MNRIHRASVLAFVTATAVLLIGCEEEPAAPASHHSPNGAADQASEPGTSQPVDLDITGEWTMHRLPGTFESEDTCTIEFTQDGEEVQGSGGGGFELLYWPGTIAGTISGTNVDLTWRYYTFGKSFYLSGSVGENEEEELEMRGTWTDDGGKSGTWYAEPAGGGFFL